MLDRRKRAKACVINSMIVTLIKKSEAPDFSEARPYQRAGYIRPRRQQFCRRVKPPLSNYWQ
jgi:hypothetical protein